jgi:hypothetical protein
MQPGRNIRIAVMADPRSRPADPSGHPPTRFGEASGGVQDYRGRDHLLMMPERRIGLRNPNDLME